MTNRFLGNVLFSTVVLTEDMFGSTPINGLVLWQNFFMNMLSIKTTVPFLKKGGKNGSI
jgi:hypothetical protein